MIKKNLPVRAPGRLPCESLIVRICGDRWRDLEQDIDGAWGIAIVRSVLDGLSPNIYDISAHLGVDHDCLRPAFTRLNLNGMFLRDRIFNDRKALNDNDAHAWCQYAGIASGATGRVIWESRKRKERS